MAFSLNIRHPNIAWSKPAQSPTLEKSSSASPGTTLVTPTLDLPGKASSNNKPATGMHMPPWLKKRLKGKPAQSRKPASIDSGYVAIAQHGSGKAILSSRSTSVSHPGSEADRSSYENEFAAELVGLRKQLHVDTERFLSERDGNTPMLVKKPGDMPKELKPLFSVTLARIQKTYSSKLKKIENDSSLTEQQKHDTSDKLGEMFVAAKKALKSEMLQNISGKLLVTDHSPVAWEDGLQLLTRADEKWLLKPSQTSLGEGAYGSIALLHSLDGNRFAGKKMNFSSPDIDLLRIERDSFLHVYDKVGPHYNLVNVFGITTMEIDGAEQRMLLMEAIDGLPGDKFFAALSRYHQSGQLSSEEYLGARQFLLARIAEGIAHINKAGIAHSDIKPENFMVCKDTLEPKIIDLGLAQMHGSKWNVGSPAFMSWDGSKQEGITEKSDVFSFAAMTVDLVEHGIKRKLDPATGQVVRVLPSEGAWKETYLRRIKGTGRADDAADSVTVGNKSYQKVKMNQVSTSYSDFVNRQLLSLDPSTGDMVPSTPAKRYTAEKAMQHPFLSDRMLQDQAREQAVIRKVYDLMEKKDQPSLRLPHQLPELRFPETSLESSINQLRTQLKLLASLKSERPWLKALETLYHEPVKSGITFYDRTSTGRTGVPNQSNTEDELKRDRHFLAMERRRLEEFFPNGQIYNAVTHIRQYVDEASFVLKGLENTPVNKLGIPDLETDIARLKKHTEIANDFLRRYERSNAGEPINAESKSETLKKRKLLESELNEVMRVIADNGQKKPAKKSRMKKFFRGA